MLSRRTLKYSLSPLVGWTLAITERVIGSGRGFHSVVLHDVPPERLDRLESLLAHIASEHGFISPEAAAACLTSPATADFPPGRRPCLITVDDGFQSAFRIGRDLFPQFGVKALFFVCPGLIDMTSTQRAATMRANMYRGSAPSDIPTLMDWSQISALRQLGHEIGAHGMTHRLLAQVPTDELVDEIGVASDKLALRLGQKPDWYAFAFGDLASITSDALGVIARHYRFCRSGVRGVNVVGRSERLLFAQEVDLMSPPAYQYAILRGALDFYYAGARARLKSMWLRSQVPA